MKHLHQFFLARAAEAPEREALVGGGLRWTCGELADRARRLAGTLRRLGIGPEVPVGICTRRTPEMVAGMIGALAAGGAYLPLDPRYPRERLRFMLEDAAAPVVLTDAESAGALPETGARTLFLDRPEAWMGEAGQSVEPDADSLAYLIYTSGSTGRPKGVAIPHGAAAHLMVWARDAFPPEDLAGVLACTSICFDLSVFEIFVPLSWGGRVILADNALALPALPAAGEVTLVNTVPSAAAELARNGDFPPSVRTINLAGEALQRALVDQLYRGTSAQGVFNLYGPSEDTTYSTWTRVPRDGTSAPAIGVPLPDEAGYVLGPDLLPVPDGDEGELYLGGPALARGYLGRPDLTAERFLPNPFAGRPGARMYRTGDLVRWRPDGELDFLGRIDHQVKIRGFRIELGEIEAALLAVPEVAECVAVARKEETGARLVAYAAPESLSASDLRAALKESLPEHMVPSAIVLLPSLPRTPNGKVDRDALPAPFRVRPAAGSYVAPRRELEERLAAIWAESLGLETVGVEDDFFELGGHSLIAGRLFSRIRQAFGADVSMRDLFATPTVAGFAARLGDGAGRGAVAIAGAAGQGEPPLSFGQERLLFLQRMEAEPITYNVPILGTLSGPLDVDALQRAFTEIVRRHEPLRTVFASRDGREVQVVLPAGEFPLPVHEVTPEAADRMAWEEFRRPLDLDHGPLLRATLLRLGAREHRLLLMIHHITWDDGSLAVLLRELPALYRGETLPPLPARYADFAAWQRARFQGAELEEWLDRWAGRFHDLPQPVELPADRPRPAVLSPRGGEWRFEVPEGPAGALRSLSRRDGAKRGGATLFMTALALFQAWLLRLTGQADLSLIAPVSTRTRVELEPLVGFFVSNLFVRTDLGGDPAFTELIGRVREAALAAFEGQELPFDLALRRLHPGNPAAVQALLRVLFSLFQEIPRTALSPELGLTLREVGNGTAKADLAFFLEDRADGGLGVRMEYAADLFEAATIQRMGGCFLTLLEGVAADPGRRLSELPILTAEQRAQILRDWNDTAVPYPREACIHELIEEHVRRAPDALALRFVGGEMTYAELNARADALAAVLAAEGVGPDTLVGLCLERSPEAIVGIVGILKAGGAFAPLDPAYPQDRLAFMLEDTAAPVLITRRGLLERLPANNARVICWEDLKDQKDCRDGKDRSKVSPENLAYVMYTSGSTGRPKGVAVTHRDVVRLARSSRFADFGSDHVFLHLGPLSFDATTLEVGYSLLNGSALAIMPPETPSLEGLGRFLVEAGVTAAWITAGLFQQMAESQLENLSKLRLVMSGGDVLSPAHVARVLEAAPGITMVNGYGPTESTVFASCHPLRSPAEVESPLPIGRPIGNTRVAVVDRDFQLAPPGVEGELWIGGDGLARGYLHRPGLTAERFVPDPFWGTGERLYRTGDLARWRADGRLEFLGRVDFQVKLRGFRIELEEIEAALASHPAVAAASVAVQGEGGDKRLVAFWTGEESEADFRSFLGGRLPGYMVPAAFVRLDALPLNAHGKVDRKALARIEPVLGTAAETEAPRNPTEELLAGIWAEVLGVERLGIRDSFFDLGGHSLLILRVLSRVRETLGADLVPRDVFDAPTIAELAGRIASRRIGKLPPVAPVPRDGDLPLSYAQSRLWFLERLGTRPGTYNVPVAFRLRGGLDVRALRSALTGLVRRHEALRTTFPARDGEPVQTVAEPSSVPLPLIDLSGIEEGEAEARRLAREEASTAFDLEAGPLLRARLIRLAPDDHVWLVNLHHIVTDGWSHGVFADDLSRLYAGAPLPGLPVQYADFSAWQRQWLDSGVLAGQLAWWARQLAGLETLDLPVDRPRPPVRTFRGASRSRRLPAELAEALGPLGRSRRATRFMTLLAATAAMLERYTGRTDLALGTPVANRSRPEVEPLIGFFVNTLVLRVRCERTGSFADLLEKVRETTLAAYARPDVPFERLVEEVRPERQLGQTPLFQVLFSYQTGAGSRLELPGLEVSESAVETGTAKFDLTVVVVDRPGGLALDVEHNTDLFDALTIDRFALHFERFLREAAARPGDALETLAMLDETERRELLARVDRQAQMRRAAVRETGPDGEAPRNATEEALAGIFGEILGLDQVGIHEDFFEIGGHSLLGTRVMSRVRKAFGAELPLRTLFERPTVAALAQVLAKTLAETPAEARGGGEEEIPRRTSPADRFPVSFSQLRLWLLDRMEPGTPAYNIPFPLRLDGPLDRQALERSLAEIVRRHEGLRTVFAYESGEPIQIVVPGGGLPVPLIDLSGLPDAERGGEARRLADRESWRGFDLSRWPLLRAALVRREPERHDLLFVIHHAVADGWSLGMLFSELGTLYEAFSAGRPSPLPELPIQYPDFAVWQRRRLQGTQLDALLGYWLGRLSGARQVLDLPTDRRRPVVLTYRGVHEITRLPRTVIDGLRRREGRGRTAFMLLLAAAETLLARWSGQGDFCVGTFIANRNRAEIERLIGFFVNILVLRADLGALGAAPTFDRLLDQVKEDTLGAYTHQDLPLERLLETLQPKRDPSRTPVFQVMLNLLNVPEPPRRIGGLTMSRIPVDPQRSNFDLSFWFQPDEEGLDFDVEYSTDLFDRATIRRLQGQFIRLLEAALENPETPLDRLPLLGPEERRQLVVEWNRTAAETHAEVPVHALFEAQARRVPDKPAVVSGSVTLTYAELDRRAAALARTLRRRGVGPETVVGVSLRRSPGMIVALLAVLKAGGAYLPLDPDYPRERLDFMIEDAGVGLVIDGPLPEEDGTIELPGPDPSNLAYIIYTSGSTGRPKGVMVTHRSLANHTASAVAGYEIRESDRILQFASLSFDTSAEEIFPCLAVGATLVLRDDSMLTSAGQFFAAAERLGVTVLNFPTAYWHELAAGLEREGIPLPRAVRLVIVGGERMLADRIESWFRSMARQGGGVRLMNSYGPTEGTIVTTRTEVEAGRLAPSGDPFIGRPIHNVQVYVLDREGEPAPIGAPGELYIGGLGVARGYLRRPDLTADRFVPDGVSGSGGEPGARLYRTGDRVRWLAGGDLEFLGRMDQQVKIRGFRVEAGEVEEALRRLPGVRDAVVDVRPDAAGTHRLVAWLVPENGALPADLRSRLKDRLPGYMLPSAFVPLPAIPKTPSNKIDRKALPEPEPVRLESASCSEPQSGLERTIAGIWQKVLGAGRVGLHDNFFDLGGHSLLLVQAHGLLREALGRDLDIMVLFQRPTVSALARELSKDDELPSFTQAQEMARRQRQVNTGRKQLMEKLMQKKKGR